MKPLRLSDIPIDETRSPEPIGPPITWAFSSDRKERAACQIFWLLEPIMGGLNYATHHALRLLTVSGCSRFGAWLAPLAQARFSSAIFSQRIVKNMKVLRPDIAISSEAMDSLTSNWWKNIGRAYAEFSVSNRHWEGGLVEVSGGEHLQAIRCKGEKVVFVSVHIGHWEAQMTVLRQVMGLEVTGPFQPEPNRFTNRLIYNLRKRRGQFFFPPGRNTAIKLHRLLRNGEACTLFYVDDVREKQIHMPLFGRPTPTKGNAVTAIKMARSTGAALVPVFMIRTNGAKYQLKILPPVHLGSSGDSVIDIKHTVELLNSQIEPVVLEHIDQWYMLAELRLQK